MRVGAAVREEQERSGRGGGGVAADVDGREEIDDEAEDLVQEHSKGAERRLAPAVAQRFHC
jgi:hypothetical protein